MYRHRDFLHNSVSVSYTRIVENNHTRVSVAMGNRIVALYLQAFRLNLRFQDTATAYFFNIGILQEIL